MNPILISILNSNNEIIPSIEKFEQGLPLKYDHAIDIIGYCEKNKIRMVTFLDDNYPKKLIKDKSNPCLIFYKGDLSLIDTPTLAVVGSRTIDQYCTTQVHSVMNRTDKTIVSGLAYGTDLLAHMSALKNERSCIGVIPSGLDPNVFYPKSNYRYSKLIEEKGLIVSIFLPNCKPKPFYFVLRNKFLVAISDTIWIVKAALGSGTMTTANFALELKKEIVVTPSTLDDTNYRGNLECISKGAKILTTLDYFGPELMKFIPSTTQLSIINHIKEGKNSLDDLLEFYDYPTLIEELDQLVESNAIKFFNGTYC
jgi:DNA processing protein